MVPAGIEPDLFDHPQPEKFRQKYQLEWPPHGHVYWRAECLSANRLSACGLSLSLYAKSRTRLLLIVSPLVSEAHENQHKQLAARAGNFRTRSSGFRLTLSKIYPVISPSLMFAWCPGPSAPVIR